MSHTDPHPTGKQPRHCELVWEDAVELRLTACPESKPKDFDEVLRSRRSARMLQQAPLEQLVQVIRDSLRINFRGVGEMAERKRKVAVSAGALHLIKGVVIRSDGAAIYYDDEGDRFLLVTPKRSNDLIAFVEECRSILPEANCDFLVLFADLDNGEEVYDNYTSLLWRDAGAVLQVVSLVAEARGLASCALGILGQAAVDALGPQPGQFVGVGAIALGLRDPDKN